VPVTVSVNVPAGVLAAVAIVKVEEPDVEIEAGLNAAAAPDGNPLTDRLTVSVNPFNALTETV